jgi:hypothetical protein
VDFLCYRTSCLSVATSVISGTLARALDNGQSRFAVAAISWNLTSSMPGTVACMLNAMRSMTKSSLCLARRTLAVVSTSVVVRPELLEEALFTVAGIPDTLNQ